MTKEEILTNNVFGERREFQSLFYVDRFSADNIECSDNIFDAMSEYAEQESIAFVEWVSNNYRKDISGSTGWWNSEDIAKTFSTKELYTLYQESKTK